MFLASPILKEERWCVHTIEDLIELCKNAKNLHPFPFMG
jgi:hypothetical protein